MSLDDQFRRARLRDGSLRGEIGGLGNQPPGGPRAYVGQVFDAGSMPTTSPGQYATRRVRITGIPAEGDPVTFTADTVGLEVVTVYGRVASVGDVLIAQRYGGHWHAENGIGVPPCTRTVCGRVKNCDGTTPTGTVTFTLTGPGFSGSCTGTTILGYSGKGCCIAVPSDKHGSFTLTASDGTSTATTTINIAEGCSSYNWQSCLGGKLRVKLRVLKCPGGDPLIGLVVRLYQNTTPPVNVTATTDSDGRIDVCLPNTGGCCVYIDNPPCPFVPYRNIFGPGAGCLPLPGSSTDCSLIDQTITPQLPITGYTCCGTHHFPIPTDGYTVNMPCGTLTLPLGVAFDRTPGHCIAVSTEVCDWERVRCYPYTLPDQTDFTISTSKSGNVPVHVSLVCGYATGDDLGLLVSWPVYIYLPPICPPLTMEERVTRYPGLSTGDCDGPLDFCPGGYVLPYPLAVTAGVYIPLTGTMTDGALNVSGVVPTSVFIPPGYGVLSPGIWVPCPCPGTATVTRNWCGVAPIDPEAP